MLRVSSDGSLAAILERKGDYGVIVDVADRTSIFELHRDGHSHHVGRFPIAFIERAGRQLIAFSPEWNRLDIVDPRTGEIVTPHASPPHESAHDLDYFHCGLLVSPDERWILDAGWVWHPVGIPTTWSMDAWFENPHEYIDGPTRRELCWRHYEWDTPACWIEDGRLALSGFGADEAWLIPAARIFDVVTGLEQRWFPGPTGDFVFDRELFAVGSAGTTVWNVARGTRLHTEPRLVTPHYHPDAKCFVSIADGTVTVFRGAGAHWLTGIVRDLAARIARERAFADLPVLGDALEAAGCDDADMLAHCQSPGPHGDRCWVLDRLGL